MIWKRKWRRFWKSRYEFQPSFHSWQLDEYGIVESWPCVNEINWLKAFTNVDILYASLFLLSFFVVSIVKLGFVHSCVNSIRSWPDQWLLVLQQGFEEWRNGLLDGITDSIGTAIDVVRSQILYCSGITYDLSFYFSVRMSSKFQVYLAPEFLYTVLLLMSQAHKMLIHVVTIMICTLSGMYIYFLRPVHTHTKLPDLLLFHDDWVICLKSGHELYCR